MAVLLLRRHHFSLTVFRIFFFSFLLNFRQFDYIRKWNCLCLFCLKFTELFEFVGLHLQISFVKFGIFPTIISSNIFLALHFFSSLSEAPVINARFFWLLSHRSLRLFSLFQSFSLSDIQVESLLLVNPPAH